MLIAPLAQHRGAQRYEIGEDVDLERHLSEACLGTVSEIFDAEPPHHPRGAVAQAWSVGELLRARLAVT